MSGDAREQPNAPSLVRVPSGNGYAHRSRPVQSEVITPPWWGVGRKGELVVGLEKKIGWVIINPEKLMEGGVWHTPDSTLPM